MTSNITIVGNLTFDPELRFSSNGNAYASFKVAVNHKTKEGDAPTTFWSCKAFGTLAEGVATLSKGSRVIVHGNVRTDTWFDDNTGEKKSRDIIYADAVGSELRYAASDGHRGPKPQADAFDEEPF